MKGRRKMGKETKKAEQYAINFLLFSYFEVDLTDDAEYMIDAAIKKAYLDATQQGAYNTLVKDNGKASEEAKQNAWKKIKENLENLPPEGKYNDWHTKLCEEITEQCYKKLNGIFSYGNAQKWVNMTMKYLYIFHRLMQTYNPESRFEKDYGQKIEPLISDFHVPIDSYIIQAVWEKEEVYLPMKEQYLHKPRTKYTAKNNSDKVVAWSQWNDKEKYLDTQEGLKNVSKGEGYTCPIEWECDAWIETAKNIKRKVNKKKS